MSDTSAKTPRLMRRVSVSSALTTLTTLALLGGALPNAAAQPISTSKTQSLTTQSLAPARTAPSTSLRAVIGKSSFPVAGRNIHRNQGRLVVHQAPRERTPRTTYGVDAIVVRGKITALKGHQPPQRRRDVRVPANGYVLSGSGAAAKWLRKQADVGAAVGIRSATASPRPAKPAPKKSARAGSRAPMGLPRKVQALYHMMWSNSGSPQLRNTPSQVNVVNLAFLQGANPTLVGWGSQSEASFLADAKRLRARGVRIYISVGGAHGNVNVANREAFVRGVMKLNEKLPLDGLDWDIEGGTAMGASDVVWISKRLKQLRGKKFGITLAPNGSNIDHYRAIAVQLHRNGALNMIGQQFYDAVVSKEAAKGRVAQLVGAGIPQRKIAIGMMVGNTNNYWTVNECIAAVRYIKARYPKLRGGYLWEAGRSGTSDWAKRLRPHLRG